MAKIKVRITATQEVSYDQTVEMTKEQYEKLIAHSDEELEDRDSSPLDDWINYSDVIEGGPFNNVTIQKEKPQKKKK